mgnify:FL=1
MTHHTINGLNYHVEERGTGAPVVMLHGFTGSTETWRPLMNKLEQAFRVVTIDLPGHGQTDAPPKADRYRMELVADDLAGLIHRLKATPAHWLGYSMGGRLALYMACRLPKLVRSLILESASPGIIDQRERKARIEQDTSLAQRIEREEIAQFVDHWQSIPLFDTQKHLPEEIRSALRSQRLKNSTAGLANSLRGMGTGVQPELWSELGSLKMPVLLITGEDDQKFTNINRRMAAAISGSRLETVPNTGHTVHLESAELYSDLVLNFLSALSEDNGQYLPHTEKSDEYERGHR